MVAAVLPEFGQFFVFFMLSVAILKIGAAWASAKFPGSPIGSGLNWFVAPA